jgi:hypothetical protein
MAVLERAQRERAFAGRFQPGVAVAFGQPEQPQAGAVAVLGVLVVRKQPRDDFAGGGVNALAPFDQPLRRPLQMRAVRRRHVRLHGREAAATLRSGVAGDAVAAQQQLDAAQCDARLHRQRHQHRAVELGEHARARAGQLLERTIVQRRQQGGDCRIDLRDGIEALMEQPGEDPAGYHLDCTFRGGLVLRRTRPRRPHRGAVVAGEIAHSVVGTRLVSICARDERARVVGHQELRHASIEMQRPHDALDPVLELLRAARASERIARSTDRRDEHLRAGAVVQCHRGSGEVDEQLLAGAPVLAHRTLQALRERLVVLAELRVAPSAFIGTRGDVLLPQQHQCDALAIELSMHAAPVGFHKRARSPALWAAAARRAGARPSHAPHPNRGRRHWPARRTWSPRP